MSAERPIESDFKIDGYKAAVSVQLNDPCIPADELALKHEFNLTQVKSLYNAMRKSQAVIAATNSPFYSHRIMWNWAREIIRDLTDNPEYASKLLNGKPLMSRVLEIHATKGTCEYNCEMCLWSDKKDFAFNSPHGVPLESRDWNNILTQVYKHGTRTVLFSGGGEPLLNSDLPTLIDSANQVGLRTHLYTNGLKLEELTNEQLTHLLKLDQLRISIHSPETETYNRIVNMPDEFNALDKVKNGIIKILKTRENRSLRVGICFVVQPYNYSQIVEMAEFSTEMGVDFLNIRHDYVGSTTLTTEQKKILIAQLNTVRQKTMWSDYKKTSIDMSDKLTALANEEEYQERKTNECFSRLFRPAIDPFGRFYHCDTKAQPRYNNSNYLLSGDFEFITGLSIGNKKLFTSCPECLPSGINGNAIYAKLIEDYKAGIAPSEQPF